MNEPQSSRPFIPDYGIPTSTEGLLSWDYAVERLRSARNYWVCTASLKAKPHATAVWGVWVNDALYVGGGPDVLWARNLKANPQVAVHLEDGEKVVILEGRMARTGEAEDEEVSAVMDAYEVKYDLRHPAPFWRLRPSKAFGWTDFVKDPTRWTF